MKKWMRREVLMVVAALALLASVVTGRERPTVDLIVEKHAPAAKSIDADIDLAKLERTEAPQPASDPFARRSFDTATPQREHVRQKPSAPALPFRYFGKVIEDGKLEVFVMNGEETVGLKAGARIGEYRVDNVSEKSITFTYLPLNTRQTLDIPAVN